ncbi:hypothetical protein GW915_02385 [bacterium]|nr:hypothetical protein [bacterium]
MELKCPSCGAKHDTDDFPDAFEMQCACGYSILMPDLSNMDSGEVSQANESGFSAAPVALDIEDEKNRVLVESDIDSSAEEEVSMAASEAMTAPEDLPDEMPYDPFELPNTKQVKMEQRFGEVADLPDFDPNLSNESSENSAFDGEQGFQVPSFESNNLEGESVEGDFASETPMEEGLEDSEISTDAKAEERDEKSETPAQKIVERVQLASMGQLLGFSYDLEWVGVGAEGISEAKNRCLKLLLDRPWLQNEIKERKISFDQMEKAETMKNLPEPLALEIYLACLEFGGRCSFKKVD